MEEDGCSEETISEYLSYRELMCDPVTLSYFDVSETHCESLLWVMNPIILDPFSDPWPKRRHHKRRFVTPDTLDALARILKPGGEFRFASDHAGFQRWTLAHVLAHAAFRWTATGPGDWRIRPADAIATRYEAKALAAGRRCVYLRFERAGGG